MYIKRLMVTVVLVLVYTVSLRAQDFGLSFSYFLPKNGSFSTPISPFSIRGLGFDFNRFIAIETGASLYRMAGLNLKDLPLTSKDPLLGPNFTLLVPAELVFGLRGPVAEFEIKGGGFFFYCFGNKPDYGNIDRAIRAYENWEIANASLSFENGAGFGYHGGAELTVYVTHQVGVSLEANYLVGESSFPLTGSYTGGTFSGGSPAIETVAVDYPDTKIDFTGLEFSVGITFSAGRGPAKPARRRR